MTARVVRFPHPDYWMVKRGKERIITPASTEAREALVAKARIYARGQWRSEQNHIVISDFECVEPIVTSLLATGFEFVLSTEQAEA